MSIDPDGAGSPLEPRSAHPDKRGRALVNTRRLSCAVASGAVTSLALLAPAAAHASYNIYCSAKRHLNSGCPPNTGANGVYTDSQTNSSQLYNKARNIYGHTIWIQAYYNSPKNGYGYAHVAYSGANVVSHFSHLTKQYAHGDCWNGTNGNSSIRCAVNAAGIF